MTFRMEYFIDLTKNKIATELICSALADKKFAEFHAKESLIETAQNRGLKLKVIKLNTMEEAQNSPSPATIFSLFLDGKFMTTDISVCMDSRFDKVIDKLRK